MFLPNPLNLKETKRTYKKSDRDISIKQITHHVGVLFIDMYVSFGEDVKIQGMFELARILYAGPRSF